MKPITKNLILITALFMLSCENSFLIDEAEATPLPLVLQKGKPNYITLDEAQVLINAAVQQALSANPLVIDGNVNFTKGINSDFGSDMGNIEYRNIFYGRRETAPDPYSGIYFLEELNSRDWEIDIAGGGGFTSIWLDGNGGDSNNNITLSTDGRGNYSKYWQTQNWIMFIQQKGVYSFPDLQTFNNNEEAKDYFISVGWRRNGSLYKSPDGTIKATY
jgi:hypothetical protein